MTQMTPRNVSIMENFVCNRLTLCHPNTVDEFRQLAEMLEWGYENHKTETRFGVFETWRNPIRQEALLRRGNSKAGAWQSSHQYGMAVDYVPWTPGKNGKLWNWAENNDYEFLAECALACGLSVPISWDKCHVEHPLFNEVKAWGTPRLL